MTTDDFFTTVEERFHDWFYDSPRILYALIRAARPSVVVEIGTFRGYAACYMARALQENGHGHLYCIDNFSESMQHVERLGDPREHLWGNLRHCGVDEWVTLIEGDSDKVEWPQKVDFAYIDGWHSYRACMGDFDRAMSAGATCICLDDTVQTVGPRMVASAMRELKSLWDIIELFHNCGMTICQRRERKPPITFSQELPNHPGTDLRFLSEEERDAHFQEAARHTGLDYSEVRHSLYVPTEEEKRNR